VSFLFLFVDQEQWEKTGPCFVSDLGVSIQSYTLGSISDVGFNQKLVGSATLSCNGVQL
jgi:hypothetical protein